MDDVTQQRMLRLLGLGMRGRGVVVGVNQVREAAKKNNVMLAVIAHDASRNSREKIVPLLNARRVRFIEVPSAARVGRGGWAGSNGGGGHRRSAARGRCARVDVIGLTWSQ